MNDTLLATILIVAAIAIAMGFTSWRIRRAQYPRELRWPKRDKDRRRKDSTHQGNDSARK